MWSCEHALSDRNLLQNIYTVTNLVFGCRVTLITNTDFGIEGSGFENLIIKNKKDHYRDRKCKGEELYIQMPVFHQSRTWEESSFRIFVNHFIHSPLVGQVKGWKMAWAVVHT